tara:strand:+ start:1202 stop:1969 length:768 start_codon:yes stop_codon:yes gene_type:complete
MNYYLYQFNNLLFIILLIIEYIREYYNKQNTRLEQLSFSEKEKLIIVIASTCGSGKSTTAKYLSYRHNGLHLDLDTIYWNKDLDFNKEIRKFYKQNKTKRIFIDGIYRACVNEHWHMADCIIIIDTPPIIRFLNIFYREIFVNKCNKGFYPVYNLLKNSTGFGYQEEKNINHIKTFREIRKQKYDEKVKVIEEKKKKEEKKYFEKIKKIDKLNKTDIKKDDIKKGIKRGYNIKIKKIEEEKEKIKGKRQIPEFII